MNKMGLPVHPKSTLRLVATAACALISVSSAGAHAQIASGPANPLKPSSPVQEDFEVATIKPASVGSDGIRFMSLKVAPDGRVRVTNWTLKNLICAAYQMGYWQLQGGPAWIEKDLYDVEAKPPDPTNGAPSYNIAHDNWTIDDANLRTMLRSLLEDRFALKTHLTTKDGPIYVLDRGAGELTLTPSKHPTGNGGFGGVGFGMNYGRVMVNSSMNTLAVFLAGSILHQPVTDETGLAGTYDFSTKNIPTPEEMQSPDPGIFMQYVKEMGLKLTKSTGPVTTLVIDSASQPSPN